MAVITGLARGVGRRDDLLLHERHLLDGDLDPEVAAGDHHAVGRAHDLPAASSTACGFSILAISGSRAVLAHERLALLDVGGLAHERQRDEVDADLACRRRRSARSFSGTGRAATAHAGDVDALVGLSGPPISTTASISARRRGDARAASRLPSSSMIGRRATVLGSRSRWSTSAPRRPRSSRRW